VDAYYDGDWHDVYEGAFAEHAWVYKYFTDGLHSVTKFRFRLHNNLGGAATANLNEVDFIIPSSIHRWDLDYIFLLPIDEGVVIIDDIASTDVVVIDGLTDPNNVFIVSATDKIEDYPDYVGSPFKIGRENTRIYFLRDDVKGVVFTVDVKYQPQFLVV